MVIRRTSGKVVELSTVWTAPNAKPRRGRKKGATTAQKQDENEKDCVKRLARTINCNFLHGDLWLTLNHDDTGLAAVEQWAMEHGVTREEAAKRDARNFLRRLGRELETVGETLRYILVTSDMDGETGETVRVHHHLIIPRVAFEQAAKLWHRGGIDYQILRDQDDYTPLAVYLMRQVRRKPDGKKYTCSRKLKTPIVSQRWATAGEELRPDRGGRLVDRNHWELGQPQYIRFVKEAGSAREQGGKTGSEGGSPSNAMGGGGFTRSRTGLDPVAEGAQRDRKEAGSAREQGDLSDTTMRLSAGARSTSNAKSGGGDTDGA